MQMRKVIGVLAAASLAMVANAEPFTYQGQLNDGGQPANGLYDISLQIKDAAVGGSVVGSGFTFTNVDVVDGLFELEFDPGDIFDSSVVWLEITIDDDGNPVILSPLTKITATPKAQHATTADVALNAPWTVAPGIITYGDGDDRVFINRSHAITSAEVFGVHGTSSSFNGMYVSGPANSRPFYGYSVNGLVSAYTYFDAPTNEWRLVSVGVEALKVDAQGDVVVANDVQAESFQFETPKTRKISISGAAFRSTGTYAWDIEWNPAGGAYLVNPTVGTIGRMVAAVSLPDGATITKMTAYGNDQDSGRSFTVSLNSSHHGLGPHNVQDTHASVSTAGLFGMNLIMVDSAIDIPVVDNGALHYVLEVYSADWSLNSMSIYSVVIECEITEAD